MSDTVFILGAGASRAAGAPLMGDFLDVAQDLLRKGKVQDIQDRFTSVFRTITALQAVHSKAQLDIDNIESVFATLEMAITLRKFPGLAVDDVKTMVDSLKVVIGSTIERTLQLPVHKRQPRAPVPYEQFAGLVDHLVDKAFPSQTVSVITFNYDLACDYAMYQARIPVDYGLGEGATHGAIPLLKLHGSLNWAYCPDLDKVVPWTIGEYFRKYHWDIWDEETRYVNLRIMQHLGNFQYQEHTTVPEPILVPPTWNKTEHHRTLSGVWSRAAQELTHAENIFVVGYSLPESDSFFRYLYALGTVGDVPLKRVWVFNPDERVEQRFKSMLGPAAAMRFRYFHQTFEESIATIRDEFPGRES